MSDICPKYVSGSLVDVGGCLVDVSGSLVDVRGSLVDVRGSSRGMLVDPRCMMLYVGWMCDRFSIDVRSLLSAFARFKNTGGHGRPELIAHTPGAKVISLRDSRRGTSRRTDFR